MPIIDRMRSGLVHEHPFYKALQAAVEPVLQKLVAEEEKKARKAGARESAQMRRSLDTLGADLGRMLNEDLREIDADELDEIESQDVPLALRLIPPESIAVYMGEEKTVSVQVRSDLGHEEARVTVEPEDVVEIVGGSTIPLTPHRTRDALVTGTIKLRGQVQDANAILTVSWGELSEVALIDVRPPREVEELEVDDLQFERDNCRIKWGKTRVLQVYAPLSW